MAKYQFNPRPIVDGALTEGQSAIATREKCTHSQQFTGAHSLISLPAYLAAQWRDAGYTAHQIGSTTYQSVTVGFTPTTQSEAHNDRT
jgi:hypothetical protein